MAQPGVELVAHLLEPTAADSLVSWGFFSAHCEQEDGLTVCAPDARSPRHF